MSYEESVKTKQSLAYQRLALLEESIENNKLVLKESLLDGLIDERERTKIKHGSQDRIDALDWAIKHIKNFK